jgi:hypothetical protein
MKSFLVLILFVTLISVPVAFAQASGVAGSVKAAPSTATKPGGCANCSAAMTSARQGQQPTVQLIPGTNEEMVVGRVENLIPIGILTVLGCEKCSAEAVNWALQQGSSFEDIERTLKTVAVMQKLDCFKSQFGPDVNARMEKPLAAAKEALAQARTRAAK